MDPITQGLLLDWFVGLDTPEGVRAELIEGEVVVTTVPDGHHEHCVSGVVGQIYRRTAVEARFSANKGLKLGAADGCYARAGIPLYLLVDRATARTSLFRAPESDDYRDLHAVAFGDPLRLPAPFVFDLETADFL